MRSGSQRSACNPGPGSVNDNEVIESGSPSHLNCSPLSGLGAAALTLWVGQDQLSRSRLVRHARSFPWDIQMGTTPFDPRPLGLMRNKSPSTSTTHMSR
jgi:hypothetical protein